MKIFDDTSGLFAALVRNDCMHVPARATLAKLLKDRTEIHTTSYVLLETLALLQARVGLEAALRFQHDFHPVITIHWVDGVFHDRAFQRLELRGSRSVSLVDCATFVAMDDTEIRTVFTYDDHFHQEGFSVVGNPEDIAQMG
jgi:predicted nucleic acid-binding protein